MSDLTEILLNLHPLFKSDIFSKYYSELFFCCNNATLVLDHRQWFLVQSTWILIKWIVLFQSEGASDRLWTSELKRIDIPHLFRRTTSSFQFFSGYFGYFSLGCAPISTLAKIIWWKHYLANIIWRQLFIL